ncbi:hypothetical protein B0T09DRAFT_350774 [Sordaria sp. MPI-SDFR-AT-0083]|nr:hypothetical protein B0T09DRAFT_350774 [Sordaria sp. MPI-SDFR-AT-0083]
MHASIYPRIHLLLFLLHSVRWMLRALSRRFLLFSPQINTPKPNYHTSRNKPQNQNQRRPTQMLARSIPKKKTKTKEI